MVKAALKQLPQGDICASSSLAYQHLSRQDRPRIPCVRSWVPIRPNGQTNVGAKCLDEGLRKSPSLLLKTPAASHPDI